MSSDDGRLTSPGIKPVIPQLLGEYGCARTFQLRSVFDFDPSPLTDGKEEPLL